MFNLSSGREKAGTIRRSGRFNQSEMQFGSEAEAVIKKEPITTIQMRWRREEHQERKKESKDTFLSLRMKDAGLKMTRIQSMTKLQKIEHFVSVTGHNQLIQDKK